jgi:hypothetical protein
MARRYDHPICRVCDAALIVPETWYASLAKTQNNICKVCQRAKSKALYLANPDRARAVSKAWYERNKERSRENNRRWIDTNADRERQARARRLATPEGKAMRRRVGQKYRANNKERIAEADRQYRQTNPEIGRAAVNRRRSRVLSARVGEADPKAIASLYALAAHMEKIKGEKYHVDHVIPLSKGGLDHHSNMVVMPATMNLRKGTAIIPALIRFFTPYEVPDAS